MDIVGTTAPTSGPESIEVQQLATEACPWCGSIITRAKFVEIQERIRAVERQRHAEQEAILKKQLQESEARVRQQLTEETERRMKVALLGADKKRQEELAEQRQALEKARDLALVKQQAQFSRDKDSFQKKLRELERKLEAKTAGELGDGAEVDLFEILKAEFPKDKIQRIKKGEPGADILHEVVYKDAVCGRIIFDSKNRQGWLNSYVTKLRQDQLDASADHAILATTVFPSGRRELSIEGDVILVNPARAVYVVTLLRSAMIRMHHQGLGAKERHTKMAALYAFITSEQFAQRMREAQKLAEDVLDLDVQEQATHQKVWKARGKLTVQLRKLLGDLDERIMGLVEGDSRESN
jgi:hypothetical protein